MGSSGDDSDIDTGTEDGVSEENHKISKRTNTLDENKVHEAKGKNGSNATVNPERQAQTRVSEKTVRITETRTKNIQGLDDLSSAVNSLDDHVQAGLQEIRNCVASLHLKGTEERKHVRTLSDEISRLSADNDKYHRAVADLQQEISTLRNQLHNQQQENEELGKKMQLMKAREEEIPALKNQLYNQQQENEEMARRMHHIQTREEGHLLRIAGRTRSKRLAKSAFSTWRKKVLQKNYGTTFQVLKEENSHLRAELLLCQEAAKQAFLRSANVLNSEAITMFQDAATRRLGLEENEDQGSLSPESSSVSSSPVSHQLEKNDRESSPANKENAERFRDGKKNRNGEKRARGEDKGSHGDFGQVHHSRGTREQNEQSKSYSTFGRGVDRENSAATQSQSTHRRMYGGSEDFENSPQSSDAESFSHYSNKQKVFTDHQGSSHYRSAGLSSVGLGRGHRFQRTDHGAIPKGKPVISDFVPDSLRQETRAFLQQLRDERMNRPEPTIPSGSEPQATMKRGLSSSQDCMYTRSCHCRSAGAKSNHSSAPYKCPYCTPINNSSFGHAKDQAKKKPEINETRKVNQASSNLTRNVILSGVTEEKKKVVYKPSASTVIIEKHINK
ncbi:uncharacterized protein [Procambarus clarkii]|uniref:uncharacterized protein n=1 Tax=Procambarus clarkii TaxID=6728 RepID=UPI001E675A2E|nr:uncharacterized protein LOC123746123 [Procambarus clarkii]